MNPFGLHFYVAHPGTTAAMYSSRYCYSVVTRNLALLGTFFVQPHPAAAPLHEIVTHFHLEHGVHAREGVGHDADERAIAQAGKTAWND